jgi:hypothetical protein
VKWLAVAGGILFVVLLVLGLRAGPESSSAPATPASQPTAIAPAKAPVATPSPPLQVADPATAHHRIALRGILRQGAKGEASQALLSVEGQTGTLFRKGDTVDRGWLLESIADDHVIVAKDGVRDRLDLASMARAPAQAASSAASAGVKPLNDAPLPGFVKGRVPPPAAVEPAAAAERNRRFVQGQQNRASGSSRP